MVAARARACCGSGSAPQRCPGWQASLLAGLGALLLGGVLGAGCSSAWPALAWRARGDGGPPSFSVDALYGVEDLLALLRSAIAARLRSARSFDDGDAVPVIPLDAFLAACRTLRIRLEKRAEAPAAPGLDERVSRVLSPGAPVSALLEIERALDRLEHLLSSRLRGALGPWWRMETAAALAKTRRLLLASSDAGGEAGGDDEAPRATLA